MIESFGNKETVNGARSRFIFFIIGEDDQKKGIFKQMKEKVEDLTY